MALTQKGPLRFRLLGETRSIEVENPSVFIATGNNLSISGDLPRRTLETRLDPNCEHPEYRKFDFDPGTRALELFPQLATAALTALRAYMQAGCPKCSNSTDGDEFDLGSFTEWDHLIRGCLLWLGYADPLTTQESIEDPMKGTDLHILATWYEMWGNEEHTINDIFRRPEAELHRALLVGRREWDPNIVSHILRKLKDRVIGDYKLVKTQDSTHGAKYKVMYLGTNPPLRGGLQAANEKSKKAKY